MAKTIRKTAKNKGGKHSKTKVSSTRPSAKKKKKRYKKVPESENRRPDGIHAPLPPALRKNRWKPGQSGNPAGRPAYSLTTILRRALQKKKSSKEVGEELIAAAIKHAQDGDYKFFEEIFARIDGKVPDRFIGDLGLGRLREMSKADLQRIAGMDDKDKEK